MNVSTSYHFVSKRGRESETPVLSFRFFGFLKAHGHLAGSSHVGKGEKGSGPRSSTTAGAGRAAWGGRGEGRGDHTTSSFESTLKWNTIFRNCSLPLDAVGGCGARANLESSVSLN